MSTILVTGASGLIGSRLVRELKSRHTVLAMSRRAVEEEGVTYIHGDCTCWEDLSQLDNMSIDAAVHLAAVTGGCTEHDAMMVNTEGSRVLMKYLANHGCKKIVLASSIAIVGFQNLKFIPDQVPITEEHICKDRDGYGLSKYLMEEVSRYINLQNPDIDILNIRLSAAGTETDLPKGIREFSEWCLGFPTYIVVEDAVKLFTLAVEAPLKPGVRIINGVADRWWSAVPTAEQLRYWWGDKLDLSWFEKAGNKYASIFDTTRLKEEFPEYSAVETLKLLEKL